MSAPSQQLLTQLSASLRRPSASYLVPAIAATALGHAPAWLPAIYAHHTSSLPATPPLRSASPLPALETIPRRRVLRELKEGLVKSAILVGVPRVIEALLELGECVEEGAKDDSFVRRGMGGVRWEQGEVERRGLEGLGRIYRDDIGPIWTKMGADMEDVRELLSVSLLEGRRKLTTLVSGRMVLQEHHLWNLSHSLPPHCRPSSESRPPRSRPRSPFGRHPLRAHSPTNTARDLVASSVRLFFTCISEGTRSNLCGIAGEHCGKE